MANAQRPNHAVDPAWSPHALVSRRLRDACVIHGSRLSEICTIESSYSTTAENNDAVHPLAQLALARTSCPQPPLDDGITGGGSSVSCDVHHAGMNVRLDPLERAAPHKIVIPFENNDYTNGFGQSTGPHGDLHMAFDINLAEVRSTTWNAITTLATLLDEIQEVDDIFQSQILPSIVLFSADDSLPPQSSQQVVSKTDVFDDDAQKVRESKLLSRIGKFMPALQLASNGVARLRKLVKNMTCQLGGCATPAVVPFYFDGDQTEDDLTPNSVGAASDMKKDKGQSTQSPVFGKGVPMFRLGKAIGIALRLLITVDTAISSNEDLQQAWAIYKDVVMEWSEQKRLDDDLDEEFQSFERMMVELDFSLMSSRSFIAAIEQNFDPRGRFQDAKYKLHDEVRHILMTLYSQTCERVNTVDETSERLDCVGVYAMYVLYRHLLPPNEIPDAKLHKSLWSVFPVMCPIMNLFGGELYFVPREFMMLYAPYEAVRGCSADPAEIRESAATLILKWDGSFQTRAEKLRLSALGWLAAADSELSPTITESGYPEFNENYDFADGDTFLSKSSLADIEKASAYILRGVKIAYSVSILLREQLLTHKALGLKHDISHIPSMMKLIEILKAIEKMLLVRRRSAVLAIQRCMMKMIASNILKIFEKVRSFVDQHSAATARSARSIARVSACLSTLEGILKGSSSFSPFRRHAISFSVAVSLDPMILDRVISTEDLLAVESYLKDLNQFAAIEETLHQVCDCSFLYFCHDLIPSFVRSLYKSSQGSSLVHTQAVLSALSDPERILNRARHLDLESSGMSPSFLSYQSYVTKIIQDEYVEPTCELIETDLRFAIYSKKSDSSKRNGNDRFAAGVRKFIIAPPLYVCHMKLNIKSEVESYLEKTFYNLSTIDLNDCNNYNEMRSIANERYGLNITDPFLPDGSLEQGLDFIDILRDLESFVSSYNYNIIEQVFVQKKADSGAKSLRTFGVRSVASSLKQHGLGVVGLTTDVCAQLLTRKITMLLNFLARDGISSLLAKELRWIGNQRKEGINVYPFSRAIDFTHEMKRLVEQSQYNENGLDWCRSVVTEMGNALAMTRMIRTARRRVMSDEMPFLSPIDISAVKSNEHKSVKNWSGSRAASIAASEVEESISVVLDTPQKETFNDIFREALRSATGSFVSGFHCMLPALSLCWMDSSLQGKEMMRKKNAVHGGFFTDDGFACGLAFMLAAADQKEMYDRLNWFKSIQIKYASDEEDLMKRMAAEESKRDANIAAAKQSSWFSSSGVDAAKEESDEMKNLKMMEKRIEGNRREMAMLFFSMNEAAAFLRSL